MGLVALSVPLGASVISLMYGFFVAHYGWRSAFLVLGLSLLVVVVVPGAVFLRRQPEDLGLVPDGDTTVSNRFDPSAVLKEPHATPEQSWSRAEAIRTTALWL